MESIMTSETWLDAIRTDLTSMETDWRYLDEQDGLRSQLSASDQVTRGKHEKEREASRLHAELAVASFVDLFYRDQRTDVGENLVVGADVHAWEPAEFNRELFAHFVRNEAERVAHQDVEVRWGVPTSTGDGETEEWWIDTVGVSIHNGREESRHVYRFHVIDGRVDAWMVVDQPERGDRGRRDIPLLRRALTAALR